MRIAKLGDIYAQWHDEIEKWTLVQIIKEEDGRIALLDIKNVFDHVPTKEDIQNIKPLIVNHHNWSGEYSCSYIDVLKVPDRVVFITNMLPILDMEINSYSIGWPQNNIQVAKQYQWGEIDPIRTKNYKTASKSECKITIGKTQRRIASTSIYGTNEDKLDKAELSKLPALTEIHFTGKIDDLIEFAEGNPLLEVLEWSEHQREKIDISKTNISKLMIDVTNLKHLTLNKEIRFLSFHGDLKHLKTLTITHPLNGKHLVIHIYPSSNTIAPDLANLGLLDLKGLSLHVHDFDFEKISEFYPNIKSIKIWGQPSNIANFKSIEKLNHLETLQLCDLFGFGIEDIPRASALPHLEFLWLTSVPRDAGSFVKKTFKNVSNLRITKLRNEKWLLENLNNPFRNWDGREGTSKAIANKAKNAFKKLNTGVEKELSEPELTTLFIGFIDVFNKIDASRHDIDTIEREEIYEVYMDLAKQSALNETVLFDLFENTRDF